MLVFIMGLGWRYFAGGCCLDRDIGRELVEVARKDGGWGKVELEESFGWNPLPYVSGTLVKR